MDIIVVDDITCILTTHASEQMKEDRLTLAHVEETVSDPDDIELSHSSGRTLYKKAFRRPKGTAIVVVEENEYKIVTVYIARRSR